MKMNIRSQSGSRRILFWIIACAAIIRFLYLAEVIRGPFFDTPVIDEQFYINRAMELVQGKPLSEEALFRAPLYPIWLWLIFMITGPGYLAPRLITMVLGTISCALIYFIGQRTFGTTCGLASAAVSALYFPFIFFEGTLLMDGLFIFFLLAFLLALLKAWDCLPPSRRLSTSGRPLPQPEAVRRWAQAGFLCAMAAIIRPNILLFAAFLILWLGIRAFRYRSIRARTFKRLTVFALFMGAVILPVTLCNYLVSGDLVLISSQAGINFYIGNNSRSTGVYTPVPGYYPFHGKYRDTVWLFSKRQAEKETGRRLLPSEVSRYWFNKGMELWKDDPLSAAVLSIRKVFIFWLGPEISNVKYVEFQRSQSTILSMPLATFHGVGPMAFIGLVLVVAGRGKTNRGNDPADQRNDPEDEIADSGAVRADNGAVSRHGEPRHVLLAFALIYILSVVLFFNCGRYRLPVVPVLIVLACFAAISLFRALREGRWKTVLLRYVPALLILGLLFNVDPYGVCGDDLGKANWSLANAYWARGQIDQAMGHYKKSLEYKPDYAPAYLNLGNCNLVKNEFEQAVSCYQQAAALNPLNSTIYNNMALAYRGMNRLEEAWSSIKNALATGDSNPFVYDTVGLLHLETGNVPDAVGALKRAVELWPGYRDAWSDLGDAYEQGGMTAEAAACREKVNRLREER